MNNLLQCAGLTKVFSEGELHVNVLKGVDFAIQPGELVAIMGASGSGKSTLLHLLGGLDHPTAGNVFIADKDITTLSEKEKGMLRNRYLGFVYQFHHLLPEFNALENVCIPLLIRDMNPREAEEKGKEILNKVGLSARYKHRIGELSGEKDSGWPLRVRW